MVAALKSRDDDARSRAFDTLARVYWRPLYKYARSRGRCTPDAEDLTQSFLARVLERNSLATFDPARASFRTFLRLLFDRHLANAWKASTRLKRGGAQSDFDFADVEAEMARESPDGGSPEERFEREWARSVFSLAVERLRQVAVSSGKEISFALFEAYDLDQDWQVSYRDLAERFGLSETAVTNRLFSIRALFRAIVLDILREATASEHEFRAEARALLGTKI
jgi:RNA polymerase sigma factor (sigma-70 family)